jgi:hypothetical protein
MPSPMDRENAAKDAYGSHEPNRKTPTSTALHGRQLFLARVVWLVVFVLTIGLFSASIPAYYNWLINLADPDLKAAAVLANLKKSGISVDFYATFILSIGAASAMLWGVVGVVIFLRRSNDWMALFTSLTLLTFAMFYLNDAPVALTAQYPALWLPVNLLTFFGSLSFALFFYLFPDGQFVPRWARWLLVFWAAHEAAYYVFPNTILDTERSFPLLDFVADLTLLCVGIGSQLYRYRRVSGPVQRQQTKWVVYGTVSSVLGLIVLQILLNSSKTLALYGSPYTFVIIACIHGSLLLIPLSIGIAILRYHLWNIDIIINRTIVYGSLSGVLTALFSITDTLLQSLFFFITGVEQSRIATFASVIVIAVAFQPFRNRIQGGVNRLTDWLAGGEGMSGAPR